MDKEKYFRKIENADGSLMVTIGSPINDKVNLFFNFNIATYPGFIHAIKGLSYLNVLESNNYDEKVSGMAIQLIQNNSLISLAKDIAELLFQQVEMCQPIK